MDRRTPDRCTSTRLMEPETRALPHWGSISLSILSEPLLGEERLDLRTIWIELAGGGRPPFRAPGWFWPGSGHGSAFMAMILLWMVSSSHQAPLIAWTRIRAAAAMESISMHSSMERPSRESSLTMRASPSRSSSRTAAMLRLHHLLELSPPAPSARGCQNPGGARQASPDDRNPLAPVMGAFQPARRV